MSTTQGPTGDDVVTSLARGRYAVMSRANLLISSTTAADGNRGPDDFDAVSGLLMTALEELKVAEEELRAQNNTLTAQRAGVDERTRHYRQVFLQAPFPMLLTDIFGTILEVNAAAGDLLQRPPHLLERKPLVAMLPVEVRDDFRRKLSRVVTEGTREWKLSINRRTDVPIEVTATVKLVPDLGPTRSGVLYWIFAHDEDPR